MSLYPVWIDGQWRPAQDPADSFQATNPATRARIDGAFPISVEADVEAALAAGACAAEGLANVAPEDLAAFLEAYADEIAARVDALAEAASRETALPVEPRLRSVELPRTMDQLRKAAAAARDGSWRRATIDTKINLRSQLEPLGGPVVVFGPNNFPFAYNAVAGGDFASAIATGNPVIAKGHPAHPHSCRLLGEACARALEQSNLPRSTVQLIYHTTPELGLRLVSDRRTGATGFTGSRSGGLALKAAADKAGKPIYLEMSSINPVFILGGALEERADEIAGQLTDSCLLGMGQFCTKPGLVVLPAGPGRSLAEELLEKFKQRSPSPLLTQAGPKNLTKSIAALQKAGAHLLCGGRELDDGGYVFENTLLSVDGDTFLKDPEALQTEAFGNASLLVLAKDVDQMAAIARTLEGNLTSSIYGDSQGADDDAYRVLAPILRTRCGRLLNDKMPTGVAVSPAMNHGGPFPATGHPGFTAVGFPAAMLRFGALRSYDNVRHERLPVELRDPNPTGTMWRLVDGEWTQAPAVRQ